MQLVVSYTLSDECTYSCQCDVPVEYESAERLLVDLESAVGRYLAAVNAQRERQQEFEREHGRVIDVIGDDKKRGEWYLKWNDFYKTNRPPDEQEYRIGRLYITHFIEDGKFVAPNVFTVDEWFAAGGEAS